MDEALKQVTEYFYTSSKFNLKTMELPNRDHTFIKEF